MDSETRTAVPTLPARHETSGLPGFLAGGVTSVAVALLLWAWALPQLGKPAAEPSSSAPALLTEVAPGEIEAASTTLGASPSLAARLRQEDRKCGAHLAMITAARAAGQPPVSLRFRSGRWFSPAYKLGDTPVRIAVPFPGLYAAGHGTLVIVKEGGEATVSLTPAWHLVGADGPETRQVSWTPDQSCPAEAVP